MTISLGGQRLIIDMKNQVSTCHKVKVFVPETDEGTKYYVCTECNKACDVRQITIEEIEEQLDNILNYEKK